MIRKAFCRNCGKRLPFWFRANALFCSEKCRKANFDTNKRKSPHINKKKAVLSVGKRDLL